MNNYEKAFTQEQIRMLKNSAEKLQSALRDSKDPLAAEFLSGELGNILDKVLASDVLYPFENIPYFELITRDCLPDIAGIYFDFYSFAKYGKPAYEN